MGYVGHGTGKLERGHSIFRYRLSVLILQYTTVQRTTNFAYEISFSTGQMLLAESVVKNIKIVRQIYVVRKTEIEVYCTKQLGGG